MKKAVFILIGLFLIILYGCVPKEVTDNINKEDKVEIVTGKFTTGEEIPVLDESFVFTPPEGWQISVPRGASTEFLISTGDRKNVFYIKMHSQSNDLRVFESRIPVKEGLKEGIEKFLIPYQDSQSPELILVDIDGLSTEGYMFGFPDNKSHEQMSGLIFIYYAEEKIIEFSYKALSSDFEETYESVINAISTFKVK
ncbi:MAG: hypothetical protein PHV06_05820 [bacterium]|nr:hypothetical protein [bacterium]